ncbi:ATP-binding protein [Hymenobacter mucosus]|uniref:ATP-binding protein n=1 Tax=Hymenobacter mucosus TaxID=1411120 RepID=UPI000B783C6C
MKGFGLGLYYVRQVAASHGGCIRLRSEVGRGSEFNIWLPEQSKLGQLPYRIYHVKHTDILAGGSTALITRSSASNWPMADSSLLLLPTGR